MKVQSRYWIPMVWGAGLGLAIGATSAQADLGWDFTPRLAISQIYTDNVTLAPKGDEEHEHVTQLNAGFALDREGAQARARLAYNLQALAYWRDSDRNDVFHQVAGDGRVALVPDRFFIDAGATFSQRELSRDGGGDNINITGDRSDVLTLRISPAWVQRFDDVATAELRYTYDRVDYSGRRASDVDSESNRFLARLDSGPMFNQFGWALSFQRTETDFDDGSSVTFQIAEALGRWNVTERFSVFGAVGDERNDFEQDASRARPDDTFWRAGATFQAADRTFMEGFVGERFFGTTYGGTLRHRLRTGQVFASYDESLTTVNEFDIVRVVLPVFDETTGRPVIVDGEPIFVELEFPDLQTGVYLRKRFEAGFAGELRRTSWALRAFDERREFELTDRTERVQGIVGNVGWQANPRTRLFANASYEDSSFADEDREDTLVRLGLGLARDLTPRTTGSIEYRYQERDSDVAARDYRENRVVATLRMEF